MIKKYHFPYLYYKHLYRIFTGKSELFSKPIDINEKIQWLEYHTDTSRWTELADKYRVRKYVAEKIGKEYLVPLLGKWDAVDEIDFTSLPNSFIVKLNNGSGDCIIVKDKAAIDTDSIKEQMRMLIKHPHMFNTAERHYLRIKPCVIAEELLKTKNDESIVDYKIWCFNGKPDHFLICTNRNPLTHHANLNYYDLDWDRHPNKLSEAYRNKDEITKPDNLQEMLTCAAKLSEGFPQVRVDFYNIDGRIYFGEMTFTSYFGFMDYYTKDTLLDMGNKTIIPPLSWRDILVSFKNRYFPIFV